MHNGKTFNISSNKKRPTELYLILFLNFHMKKN